MILPAIVAFAIISKFAYVFFPRFVFLLLPFILLIAVRGGFSLAERLLPSLPRQWVFGVGIAAAIAALAIVPRAWLPKQDFIAAANYVATHRQAGDAYICLGLSHMPMHKFMGIDCQAVDSLDALARLEASHRRLWLVYTLANPTASQWPDVWRYLQDNQHYAQAARFDGTLGGGEITILLRDRSSAD